MNNLNKHDRGTAHPCLFLSINVGMTDRTYVHEQIRRRMTSSSDWKLNRADFEEKESAQSLYNMEYRTSYHLVCQGSLSVQQYGV